MTGSMRIIRHTLICEPEPKRCGLAKILYDTGSTDSLIKEESLKRLFPDAKLAPSHRTLRLADGKPAGKAVGTVDLDVGVKDDQPAVRVHFEVVKELAQDAIVGADTMEKYEMTIKMKKPPQEGEIDFKDPDILVGTTEMTDD